MNFLFIIIIRFRDLKLLKTRSNFVCPLKFGIMDCNVLRPFTMWLVVYTISCLKFYNLGRQDLRYFSYGFESRQCVIFLKN